jgi:hypothetical protein
MRNGALLCLALALGCDPNIVDAVRLPPEPPPSDMPMGTAGMPPDSPLSTSLIHRYSFDGEGDVVLDSKFSANGRAIGAELTGSGTLTLAGEMTGQHVALPNHILAAVQDDATFEAWLTWSGGHVWERIFDFGSNNATPKDPDTYSGVSYLFLTPLAANDPARPLPSGVRLAYAQTGVTDEDVCDAQSAFPMNEPAHVAAVIDHTAGKMALYLNGALLLECPLHRPLSAINDVNNWLGRSNYSQDNQLSGSYDEFRIYNAALTAAEIAESFAAGPNATP